jgi:hypothetical protein
LECSCGDGDACTVPARGSFYSFLCCFEVVVCLSSKIVFMCSCCYLVSSIRSSPFILCFVSRGISQRSWMLSSMRNWYWVKLASTISEANSSSLLHVTLWFNHYCSEL